MAERRPLHAPPLPRAVLLDPRHEALQALLESTARPLREDGIINLPLLPFTPRLRQSLAEAVGRKQAARGLEQVEALLDAELKGIDDARRKSGAPPARRLSRLLFIPRGGSERHLRHCERLLIRHEDRALGILLDVESEAFSSALFGPNAQVKLLAVMEKGAVGRVLLSLLG